MELFSDKELNRVVRHFSIAEQQYRFSPLTDGFINDTFLVSEEGAPQYILQRVNHTVFHNISGVMNNIQHALHLLDGQDYTKIRLVKTRSGASYLDQGQGEPDYWRMMTYIPKSTAHSTTTNPKIAFEAGRIIVKFHDLLQNAKTDNYVDTIPRFHDLALRKEQFDEALPSTGDTARAGAGLEADAGTDAASAIRFAKKTFEILEKIDFGQLPVRICHNDTKLNNILFSKETDEALCLIDLDTLMKGHFLYDFGDAVRTIANTAPEDEQDHSKITFEAPLFEAFVEGLATQKSLFSSREIETLAWGAVLMPFLHGIRALTDYLNGNVYYKVAYENQNLDRSLSLFNFTKKALAEMDYMEEIILRKFS